jgi:DNA mismatch endonuclease, patch repair protein
MDNISPDRRSKLMSRIRSKDTLPERLLWELLRELDTPPERWSCMPGKPDFVFEDAGVVVFVDGCFFHRCPRHSSDPKTNRKFWSDKFECNVARDKRVNQTLRENGWEILRFWECHIKRDPDDVLYQIESRIAERMQERSDDED